MDYEAKTSELREKLAKERDELLEKERAKLQSKLGEQYERLETQFNEERKRWKESSAAEYDRLEALRRRDKESLEE